MKRNLLAGLALSLLVSAPVFAQSNGGGIGRAGTYQTSACSDYRRAKRVLKLMPNWSRRIAMVRCLR